MSLLITHERWPSQPAATAAQLQCVWAVLQYAIWLCALYTPFPTCTIQREHACTGAARLTHSDHRRRPLLQRRRTAHSVQHSEPQSTSCSHCTPPVRCTLLQSHHSLNMPKVLCTAIAPLCEEIRNAVCTCMLPHMAALCFCVYAVMLTCASCCCVCLLYCV